VNVKLKIIHIEASEKFRRMNDAPLVLLKISEGWMTLRWCFWKFQRDGWHSIGASENFRGMDDAPLVLLKISEASMLI